MITKTPVKPPTKHQIEVLTRVLKYLKEEPDRLNMYSWGDFHIPTEEKFFAGNKTQPIPACKTTHCVGGTVLMVTKKGQEAIKYVKTAHNVGEEQEHTVEFPDHTDELAKEILHLTDLQAGNLFYFKRWGLEIDVPTGKKDADGDPEFETITMGWPEKYSTMYEKAKDGKGRYKATEARIHHFFKTGL